jgi:hypothetical protein
MPVCAYCGKIAAKLTKEHLWPAALHRRINEANQIEFGQPNTFYLDRIKKNLDAEPQVRDVCAICNNRVLSALDGYICELWDRYFKQIVEEDEEIDFCYEYSGLSRWLLKMCYNSARIHNSDIKHLQACCGYILTGNPHRDAVAIHLQLTTPSKLSAEELGFAKELGLKATRWAPRMNRVGHLGYMTRRGIGRLTRAVHLQSYVFVIHLFPAATPPDIRRADLEDFCLRFPFAVRLSSEQLSCRVRGRGLDSKLSLELHYAANGGPTNASGG